MKYPMYAIREADHPYEWLCSDDLGRLYTGENAGCAGEEQDRCLFDSKHVAARVAAKINTENKYVCVIEVLTKES